MNEFSDGSRQWAPNHEEFVTAWCLAVEQGYTHVGPWVIYTSESQVLERSEDQNGRYPSRKVLCFAEREDTDDVACLMLEPDATYRDGTVLVVHDYAAPGMEVDANYGRFWDWFRAALDDMVNGLEHWHDPR